MKKNSIYGFVFIILIGVVSVYPTTVPRYNLSGMVAKSERIFVGKCLSMQEQELQFPRGTLWYTEYTFQVSETIKGNVGETITFRQYGLTRPKKIDENTILYNHPIGMPAYQEDREYMLFLLGDSELGLTSPVGLFQGSFLVYDDEFNQKIAVNGLQNRGLFQKTPNMEMPQIGFTEAEERLIASKKGAFVLSDFVSVVKKFARTN